MAVLMLSYNEPMSEEPSVTRLLQDVRAGDQAALDRLMPVVYQELRKLADSYLRRERAGHTLQPTALVHEAYMRLVGQEQPDYQNRSHFYGIAAQLMRQILVDHARRREADKRGGGVKPLPLQEAIDHPMARPGKLVELDDALAALEKLEPRRARFIEMRFFGGMTAEQTAEATGVDVGLVRRELRIAQAWLQRELDRRNE